MKSIVEARLNDLEWAVIDLKNAQKLLYEHSYQSGYWGQKGDQEQLDKYARAIDSDIELIAAARQEVADIKAKILELCHD